jgi:DNA-binding response OmpR family regulator
MTKREERVLIVEDDATVARAIEQAGEEFCFRCDRATDGWEAIEKLETEQYSAIVIDTDVPRHSGFGVLNYLREEVGDDLPNVIVMTDRDDVRSRLGEKLTVVRKGDAVAELTRVLCAE